MRKNVLFIGLTDYDLQKEDARLREKWEGLARDMDVYILARGSGWHIEKYNVHFYLFPKFFGRLSPFIWSKAIFVWGLYLIFTKKIDVIISQSPSLEGLVATLLAKLMRTKLVIEVHGDWVNGPFYYYNIPFQTLVKRMLRGLGKFSLRHADTVRVISEATRKQVLSLAPRARIVKFIAFTQVEDLLNEKDIVWNPVIVFVGSLYKIKGVHVLIEACLRIKDMVPDMRVEIFGKGPMEAELRELALPLGDMVIFNGHQPLCEIKETLKKAGVLVLPSFSEGLGLVLVEAAALGKPLIGTNVGGIPEVVREGQNGFLVTPEDAVELSNVLQKILCDRLGAEAMGAKSREMVRQEFGSDKFFVGYRDMLSSL